MITITNPKGARFVPQWASFRGFSLLFDNPGESLSRTRDRLELTCDVAGDPELSFYRALRTGLEKMNINLLTNTYLFCPLSPSSYHVTLWDGGNDGNLSEVTGPYSRSLGDYLEGLPDLIADDTPLTEMAAASPLVLEKGWSVRFKFDRLIKWTSVLVAGIAPADEESTGTLQQLTDERSRLSATFRERFGIGPSETYSPHVSLGYFANRETAQLASPCEKEWEEVIQQQMEGLTLTFQSASLYGFTDMATFFKAVENSK